MDIVFAWLMVVRWSLRLGAQSTSRTDRIFGDPSINGYVVHLHGSIDLPRFRVVSKNAKCCQTELLWHRAVPHLMVFVGGSEVTQQFASPLQSTTTFIG